MGGGSGIIVRWWRLSPRGGPLVGASGAQLCGGGFEKRMEKSKPGLVPMDKGDASYAAFLLGGFADALL